MTEKLSERVRRGDFAEWRGKDIDGYPDYRLSPDKIADEIAALEQRLDAAEAEKQQAIDAALESVNADIEGCQKVLREHRYGVAWKGEPKKPTHDLMEDGYWCPWHMADIFLAGLKSHIGTNPLAEAQARIAELEELRDSVERMYETLRKYWPEGTINGLVEEYQKQQARIAELERENARLETVPMKYRRMMFNAALQKKVDDLTAQLEAAQKDAGRYLEHIQCMQAEFRHCYIFITTRERIASAGVSLLNELLADTDKLINTAMKEDK